MKQVFLFIPDTLNTNNVGFLEGFLNEEGDTVCCYITNNVLKSCHEGAIGYCGYSIPKVNKLDHLWVYFNTSTHSFSFFNRSNMQQHYVTCVYYDYKTIAKENAYKIVKNRKSTKFDKLIDGDYQMVGQFRDFRKVDQFQDYRKFDQFLITSCVFSLTFFLKVMDSCQFLWQYSEFFVHVQEFFFTIHWAIISWKNQKLITVRIKNVLFSMVIDIIFGVLTIYLLLKYETEIIDSVNKSAEFVIYQLKQVLHTLMGSPGGLKLNDALNHSLAKFFFYHISLWKTFIEANHFLLPTIFRIFITCGVFGISFQVAMFSDLISFLTFHVYCIYVYAARLYGIQIYGIEALWKLFIGRKFNPLRKRIDSFDYTVNQLFVGTLGFTILLFLLPTIFLYYSVFTLLRIVLLMVNETLARLRFLMKNASIYIIFLWMFNSSKVKGSLDISLHKNSNCAGTIYATLKKLPLRTSISKSLTPQRRKDVKISWALFFKGVFTGTLL